MKGKCYNNTKPRISRVKKKIWRVKLLACFSLEHCLFYTRLLPMQQPKFDIATYPTLDTIRLLSSLLERMCLANDQLNRAVNTRKDMGRRASSASLVGTRSTMDASTTSSATPPTRFHARALPTIDIFSYLSRILRYCPCSNECFLSLLVYFDRMSKNQLARTGRPFSIDSYNIHRLIIAGIMVSSKYFSDVYYTNTRYAKVRVGIGCDYAMPILTHVYYIV